MYEVLLNTKGVFLEEVIEWFFTSYISSEFSLTSIKCNMPAKTTSYAHKCVIISSLFDSILKQFDLLVQENEIDLELLAMSSNSKKVDDINSFLEKKYVYSAKNNNNCSYVMHLLFSDQSPLLYTEKTEEKYYSLPQMLFFEEIYLNDFAHYQQEDLLFLEKENFIQISETQHVEIINDEAVYLLGKIYNYKVVSYYDYKNEFMLAFNFLEEKSYIEFASSLLSKPESNYYNYMLIKGAYRNSLEIRNKYIHGIQGIVGTDDDHKNDYHIMLHLMILLIIKINHELCHREVQLSQFSR